MRSYLRRSICVLAAALIVACGSESNSNSGNTTSMGGTAGNAANDAGGSPGNDGADAGGAPTDAGPGGSRPDGNATGAVGNYDFSCQSSPWPGTAPATITWAGKVYDLETAQTIGGASIEIHAVSDDSLLASGDADSAGAFSFSLTTGGKALAVYARSAAKGYVTSYGYQPYPLYQDDPARNLHMISTATRASMATGLGVTLDPTASVVFVHINDCAVPAGHPGGTVTFSPAAEAAGYVDGSGVHPGNTAAAVFGAVVGLNVPVGPVDVTVTYGGKTWRPLPIKSFADALVYTPRRP